MKYRKKPVVIEAVQWRGNNWNEVQSFMEYNGKKKDRKIRVKTPDGCIYADEMDWVIKGKSSELGIHWWPVKPDYFQENYEPVE